MRTLFLAAFFAIAVVLPNGSQAAPLKPNIILIVSDDVGYGDIGANGPTAVKTPNIDKISIQGVRMEAGYSAAPMCTPSRAGLLTGRYPQRYGAENNAGPSYPHYGLPLTEMTLADILKNAGYATGAIGKWHLGDDPQFHPNRRGFNYFYGFAKACCHSYFPKSGDQPIQRNGVTVEDPPYTTTAFGNEAVNFIDRNKNNPFFLYVAFNAAHEILQAPQSYINRYPGLSGQRRLFAAVVSAMDDEIGKIVAKADTLSRSTLIIFVSDNGAVGGQGSNSPFLSGGKGTLAEAGIRLPFEMRMKGIIPVGKVIKEPISQLDIFPTVAALAGAQLPPKSLDGLNIWPLLTGSVASLPQRSLFFRYLGGPPQAIRRGDFKLLTNRNSTQLYNVAGTNERVVNNSVIAAELKSLYNKWNAQMIDPLWWNK